MKPLIRGFFVMVTKPRLWGYVWKPLAWAAVIYLLLLVLGQMYLLPLLIKKVGGAGWLEWTVGIVGGLSLTLLWVVAANFLLLATAGLISSFLWEKLSLQAEHAIYGNAPERKTHLIAYIIDAILRLVFAAFILTVSLFFGWLGIVIGAAAAGLLSLVDFSAPAYWRRGVPFPLQLKVLKAPPAMGFLLACGALSLLPFVFVLMIPAMVVGGTIVCREAEEKPADRA